MFQVPPNDARVVVVYHRHPPTTTRASSWGNVYDRQRQRARRWGGVSMIDNAHRAARAVYCPFARSSSNIVIIKVNFGFWKIFNQTCLKLMAYYEKWLNRKNTLPNTYNLIRGKTLKGKTLQTHIWIFILVSLNTVDICRRVVLYEKNKKII